MEQKIMKSELFFLALPVLALVIIGASFALPWWTYESRAQSGENIGITLEFKLTEVKVTELTSINGTNTTTKTISYSDRSLGNYTLPGVSVNESLFMENDTKNYDDTIRLYTTTMALTGISVAFIAVGLLCHFLVKKGKLKNKLRVIFVLIAFLLSLLTVLYFPLAYPSAVEKDNIEMGGSTYMHGVIGSEKNTTRIAGVTLIDKWGPGSGWYAMFTGMFVNLIYYIAIRRQYIEQTLDEKFRRKPVHETEDRKQ